MRKPRRAKPRKPKALPAPPRVEAASRGEGRRKSLGQQLLDTIEDIIELMEHTQDLDRLKELNAKRVALSSEARRLIDASLDTSTAAYREAVVGLEVASASLREAIRGLESVKNAILMAAKAAVLVAKVGAAA